jgi:hypothetical protein
MGSLVGLPSNMTKTTSPKDTFITLNSQIKVPQIRLRYHTTAIQESDNINTTALNDNIPKAAIDSQQDNLVHRTRLGIIQIEKSPKLPSDSSNQSSFEITKRYAQAPSSISRHVNFAINFDNTFGRTMPLFANRRTCVKLSLAIMCGELFVVIIEDS